MEKFRTRKFLGVIYKFSKELPVFIYPHTRPEYSNPVVKERSNNLCDLPARSHSTQSTRGEK